jgi:hypothetical protein
MEELAAYLVDCSCCVSARLTSIVLHPRFRGLIGIAAQRRDLGKDCGTALDNDKYSKENAT